MRTIAMIVVSVAFISGVIALSYHQWSDCLEENSFFTCARMLIK